MRFEVGAWYSFNISGLTSILDKGECYVLTHESGRKMLLKASFYTKYHFFIGQKIECRIDKVSCTGQVFLEPKHPIYSEGNFYSFPLIKVNKDAKSLFNGTVKDAFDNEIDVFIPQIKSYKINESILLKVVQVKKGIAILQQDKSEVYTSSEKQIGNKIKLRITNITKYNSEDYYILTEENVEKAKLKVKHFKKYGFVVGDKINCMITGMGLNNSLVVEPINPWYELGKSYLFQVESIVDFTDLEGKNAKNLIALDIAENKCGVKIDDLIAKRIFKMNQIKCKVIGFRKGRPQLEIDPVFF